MQYHLLVTLPFFLLLYTGLALTFKKAGESWWKALIPIYNVYVWLNLIGRPKWWIFLFLVPVLNFIMGITLILDLVRSFGKNKFIDHALAVLFPYIYFIYLGLNKKDKFQGKWSDLALHHKKGSTSREWLDAILFAGTAALLIRTFMIEAFMIPTTSMEGSLLAGDFLFVSKMHYGVRMPMAPLSIPFVHNTFPFTSSTKSYLDWIELPYSRLPAFKKVERNEIVVFNYPDDDLNPDVPALGQIGIISMKQNYIKRCVAISGDTLQVKNGVLFINGAPAWKAENQQTSYRVRGLTGRQLEKEGFRTGANDNNANAQFFPATPYYEEHWLVNMNEAMRDKFSKNPRVTIEPSPDDTSRSSRFGGVKGYLEYQNFLIKCDPLDPDPRSGHPKDAIFPKKPSMFLWTKDNFGPLVIPKKGATITLNDTTYALYWKCIDIYEDNELEIKGGKYIINGSPATTYTFKMDYYWMMGDNRHQSLDSRYWGYVPEDHIIGRPWFVLFSWEGGPRWNRFFRPATSWEP